MATATITLSDEERAFLVHLLELALKEARVEEHRTRNSSFREHVLHREELLSSVLQKLGQLPT